MKRKILIRCDAGNVPQLGTGHLQRSLWLAAELKARGNEIIFLTTSSTVMSRVQEHGHRAVDTARSSELSDAVELIRNEKVELVVWDCLNTDASLMQALKETGAILITLDDRGSGQPFADITINSMVLPVQRSYSGFSYVILPEKSKQRKIRPQEKVERLFLSFGGYDHSDLTYKTLSLLHHLGSKFEINVVVGQSYKSLDRLQKLASSFPHLHLYQAPVNFSQILRSAELAILNGGLTLVEALSLGIPSLAIGQYDHQMQTIERLEKEGAVVNLGPAVSLSEEKIRSNIDRLLQNPQLRESLSNDAIRVIDGEGLNRVAELVLVVDRLAGDSDFFQKNIARLYPPIINENLVQYAIKKCEEDQIDCLYYLCDCHDPQSVVLAEKYGFHFVDIRMSFFRELHSIEDDKAHFKAQKVQHRPAVQADIPILKKIASNAYLDSRYYFDGHFPKEDCDRFYVDWLEKSFRGFADQVIVAEVENDVLGFICCKINDSYTGQITLVGISEHAKGQGVGNTLVARSLEWFKQQGLQRVEAVTQGRNYFMQRLYQKCGFRTLKTELWYHKWLERKER